ncbi:MAG: GntR family transcriptional regulator [Phycisphaerae bacterium]
MFAPFPLDVGLLYAKITQTMPKAFDESSVDRVAALNTLRSWIEGGSIAAGESLPSERVLAERLAVGRTPVRWAVSRLDQEGWIRKAGLRTRIVVRNGRAASGGAGSSLLAGAVVLLSGKSLPTEAAAADASAGWNFQVNYGALEAVRAAGRDAFQVHDTSLTNGQIEDLRQANVAGVVALRYRDSGPAWGNMARRLQDVGVRLVASSNDPEDQALPRVVADHEAGAYQLCRHLIEQGRRRILHMTTVRPCWWSAARLKGYRRAMHEAGLSPLPPAWVAPSPYALQFDGSAAQFEVVARHNVAYLAEHLTGSSRPDAIMCLSDESVSFIAAAVRLCHLVPNQDVWIAGYDNTWHDTWGRRYEPTPPVATVEKNNPEVGRQMVDLLLDASATEPVCRRIEPVLVTAPVADGSFRRPVAAVSLVPEP